MADRRHPAYQRAHQERLLSRDVAADVYPYSAWYRARLEAAGLGRKAAGSDILRRLPLTSLDGVHDPADLVLRPEEATLQRFAPPGLLLQIFWAKLRRRADRLNRNVIEPRYKPVHWHLAAGVPIAYTDADLTRLADLGRHALALAGLGRYDVAVTVLAAEPDPAWWELVLGFRRAGVSALHLGDDATGAQVRAASPAVLAGRVATLERVLAAAGPLPQLHTLVVAGEVLTDRARATLRRLAPGAAVVGMWAPPAVRSLWVTCRGGDGYHTEPDAELVEVVDPATGEPAGPGADGEVVWTGLGWKGTVLLRLRTGVIGVVDDTPCPTCGRTSPRVHVTAGEPPFARVLDAAPEVRAWQAELRTVDGHEELIVTLAVAGDGHPGRVLRALDRELSVTQFVVLPQAEVEARLASAGHRRVLDHRLAPR